MRYFVITCLMSALCAGGDSANASANARSAASAGIMATATVDAPLGVFFDKEGALKLEAPNNSGVFVEQNGQNSQEAALVTAFVTMSAESNRAGVSPRIATKLISNIFDNAILHGSIPGQTISHNVVYNASSTLLLDSSTATILILTVIYTEN